MRYLLIALALVGILALAHIDNTGATIPQRQLSSADIRNANLLEYTKRICDNAHNEHNGQSEYGCAYLQQTYGVEYLCNSQAKGAYCWAEMQ